MAGLLALPGALALLALPGRPRTKLLIGLLAAGTVMAIATSESRTVILGTIFTLFAFALMSVTSKGGFKTIFALGAAGLIVYLVLGLLGSSTGRGSFDRYESISSPGTAVTTAYNYRRGTLEEVPGYMTEIPFGGGIGSSGPAGSFGGGNGVRRNGESEPTS